MIDVSEASAAKIGELLVEENKAASGLRVFVQGGGCSGFQYGLMIEETARARAIWSSNRSWRQAVRRPHQHPVSEERRGRLR